MRGFLRFVWMTLVLLIVALMSALITMSLAVHGREVEVPNLAGKTPGDARRLSEFQGLSAKVEREYYSASVPEGRVISQSPAPGTMVRHGWEIALAVSLGPQRVTIPDVVGESQRAANIVLQQRGLQISSVAAVYLPNSAAGDQVVAQSPSPNAVGIEAPKVSILVSQGTPAQEFVMPTFIGQPLGSVALTLKNAGFPPARISVQSSGPSTASATNDGKSSTGAVLATASPQPAFIPQNSSPASIIVSQDPAPGLRIAQGSVINLVVR